MARRYDLEDRLIGFGVEICRLIELRETQTWLKFCDRMGFGTERIELARRECGELVAIFVASIRTARGKVKMSNVEY